MRLPKKGVVLLLTLLFSVAATWIPLPFPSTGWKPWIGTALWLAVVFLSYLFLESEFESVRQFRIKTKHYVVLAIVFFVFGSLGVVLFGLFQSQQEKGEPSLLPSVNGTLDGEILRLVWHENAEKAMLYLEIQILNKGIAPTIVRGYRVHANLSSGMRIDGINTMIHLGQQLQTDRYTITIRKIVYEERLRRLQMEPKLRDGSLLNSRFR